MAFGIGGKLKDFLGSAANKVADKIVPKELAPFLPLLAPVFMGPQAGIMSRYLMPQLLTALSSGKTAGDISGTGQVLTGLGSLLSDPRRLALSQQTDPVAATAGNNQSPFIESKEQLVPREDFIGIPSDGGMGVPQLELKDVNIPRMPNPDYIAPTAAIPSQPIYDISQIDNPTLMDYLKTGVNEAQDFMQGLNTANTYPGGPEVVDAAGNAVLVRDAGFMQNLPRRAVMQGIQGIGPASTAIDKYKADQDAEAARLAEEQEAYNNAVAELGRYYSSLADPDERFGFYYNQGGLTSLKPKRGLVNEPGGYAGEEDDFVKALIKMMGPLPTTGGNNYQGPSIVGGTDYVDPFQELVDQGFFKVVRNINQKANGGRVGLNMGGIMNAGSIPQTPTVPEGMQLDGRGGGFIPMGAQEKKDDVPAMLAKNEFVMTSDAVRAAGGGSIEKGAQRMYDMMNQLEAQV
tara:strand:+ start:125 stop:1507 length:1383 start_codon:yes stop_codon:yes gene_type:complete